MFGILIAMSGFLVVALTLYLILKEFRRGAQVESKPDASFYDTIQNVDDEIERLREEVDGMNASFYEVVDELNDRVNKLKRSFEVHQTVDNEFVSKETNEKLEVDISLDVEKTSSYHTYEKVSTQEKKTKKFKEVQVFPEQSIRKQIMELHHQGKTPFEIAKEVDRGTGEVQLILNLLGEK